MTFLHNSSKSNILKQNKPIIIFDSNIWLSFMIGKTILKVKEKIEDGEIQIIITEILLEEISKVAKRRRFRKYFNEADVEAFLEYVKTISIHIEIKTQANFCRDEKDNYLLALAVDSSADYLVTGDKDLLILEKFENTLILRFRDFYALIDKKLKT